MVGNKIGIQDYYQNYYQVVQSKKGVGYLSKVVHKSIEANLTVQDSFPLTVELGSGSGEHFRFVKHTYDKYVESDINVDSLPHRTSEGVIREQVDAQNLRIFQDESVDRIIATCLLIHIQNPEEALLEWKRVLKKNGKSRIDIYIPCEPGVFLRFARFFTTAQTARQLGVNHSSIHYREHRYHFVFLKMLVNEIFEDGKVSWRTYPVPFLSWNFSLWKVVSISY